MKKIRVRTIRIYHDKASMISDWGVFLFSILLILGLSISMINVINTFDTDSKLIAMIVLMFTFVKIIYWVRLPIHYSTSDLIEDINEDAIK